MRKIFTTENLIYLTVFLLPSYLIRFQIFGVPTNALEFLILLTIFVCFSQPANRQLIKKYVRTYVRGYVLSVLLILAGLLLSIAVNEDYRSELGILKSWFILPILFALTIAVAAKHESVQEKILKSLYFSTFGVSLVALFYFFAGKLTYDGRLTAFYLSPNYLAMFLAPGVCIGFFLIIFKLKNLELFVNWKLEIGNYKKKNFIKSLLVATSFAVILFAFYLTYSYAAWASVITSLAIIKIITQNKNQKNLLVTGYGLLTIFIIIFIIVSQWHTPKFQDLIAFDERSSLASRMMIWKSAAKIALDNPLFGIGPGNFQNMYLEYQKYFPLYLEWAVPQPHNLYLAFWLQSGLLGLLGFARLVTLWIKSVLSATRQIKNDFIFLETALLGIMFYILIHGLLDTTYWKNDLAVIFWIIFALGISTKHLPSPHTK